jgi:hypothetical protein
MNRKTRNNFSVIFITLLFCGLTLFSAPNLSTSAGAGPTVSVLDLRTNAVQGYVGDLVQVAASHLAPNHYYKIYVDTCGDLCVIADTVYVGFWTWAGDYQYSIPPSVQTDQSGSFTFNVSNLPDMYGGTAVFKILDDTTSALVAQTTFSVLPSMSLSTTSAPIGSEIFIQITGFSNRTNITTDTIMLTIPGVVLGKSSFDYINSYFSIQPYFGHDWWRSWGGNEGDLAIAFQLPSTAIVGNTLLTVVDSTSGDVVSAKFNVTQPTFTVTANGNPYGYCGNTLIVTGSGLAQNTAYQISIDSATNYLLNGAEGTMTDSSGNLYAVVSLPNIQPGVHNIRIYDDSQLYFKLWTSPAIIASQDFRTSWVNFSDPGTVTAGVPFQITVTVHDINGNLMTGYTGTLNFTSSDTGAYTVLPADYTFTPSDQGTHTFTVTLTSGPVLDLSR